MTEPSEWISVGALGAAFEQDANRLPQSTALVDRTLTLNIENGWVLELRFISPADLLFTPRLTSREGWVEGQGTAVTYLATEIRPGIAFVNFIDPGCQSASVTAILDSSRGVCTLLLGQLPMQAQARTPLLEHVEQGRELTQVGATFLSGTIDQPFSAKTERHLPTMELVGKRVEYTYGASERYEHVYLNDKLYTWHCLAGSEQGLADTDRCHYLKLAADLYLFVWREKIVPTLGIVIVDLRNLQTTGAILGYRDFDFGSVTNFAVGARARVLNTT